MAVRTLAREVETVLPKVVELRANYHLSGDVAKQHNGTRITLDRLTELLDNPDFVKALENTESYKRNGYVWFWTETVGTERSGYYRRNPQGKTEEEKYIFISDSFDSKVQAVPFNERAYFWKGKQPLSVYVGRSVVDDGRLGVVGDDRLDVVAPVVVVEQASSKAKPTKAANGVVVPTAQFNAAKEAFRKVEPIMHPGLADAFRAVFGE